MVGQEGLANNVLVKSCCLLSDGTLRIFFRIARFAYSIVIYERNPNYTEPKETENFCKLIRDTKWSCRKFEYGNGKGLRCFDSFCLSWIDVFEITQQPLISCTLALFESHWHYQQLLIDMEQFRYTIKYLKTLCRVRAAKRRIEYKNYHYDDYRIFSDKFRYAIEYMRACFKEHMIYELLSEELLSLSFHLEKSSRTNSNDIVYAADIVSVNDVKNADIFFYDVFQRLV